MRVMFWALRLFLFFTLFAFALNNEQAVVVHWFFGAQWTAPFVGDKRPARQRRSPLTAPRAIPRAAFG